MPKHTPGPWAVEPLQSTMGADMAIVAPGNGWVVAVVQHDPDIQTDEDPDGDSVIWHDDDLANAALIAAAPALLNALRGLLDTMPSPSTRKGTATWDAARALVASL